MKLQPVNPVDMDPVSSAAKVEVYCVKHGHMVPSMNAVADLDAKPGVFYCARSLRARVHKDVRPYGGRILDVGGIEYAGPPEERRIEIKVDMHDYNYKWYRLDQVDLILDNRTACTCRPAWRDKYCPQHGDVAVVEA